MVFASCLSGREDPAMIQMLLQTEPLKIFILESDLDIYLCSNVRAAVAQLV